MKAKKGYVYSSTELSRYYGISIKGMEFYEQKKLIHPKRIGTGKIRQFGLEDCYRLATARMLHNCGFSLDKTAYMLENNTASALCEQFEEHAAVLEKEILQQQGVLSGVRRINGMIEKIRQGNTQPELTLMPAFRRLFIRKFNGVHGSTREETDEFSRWNSFMPITEASLRFPLACILSESQCLDTEVGMIVSEEDFLKFGFATSGRVTAVPSGKAVHGFISCPETMLDEKKCLQGMLDFAQIHGLTPARDCISRFVFLLQDQGHSERWDECWLPIK